MIRRFLIILSVCFFAMTFQSKQSYAFCFCTSCDCTTMGALHTTTRTAISAALEVAFFSTKTVFINNFMVRMRYWPAMRKFAEQMHASTQKQYVEAAAKYNDAMQAQEAVNAIAQQKVKAILDTMPSEETCAVLSVSSSLAGSSRISKATQDAFRQQFLSRNFGMEGSISHRGSAQERLARFQSSVDRYFSENEMGGAVADFSAGTDPARFSADISPYTLFGKDTLDIDVSDATLTTDEEDSFMFKSNLYNNITLTGLSRQDYLNPDNFDEADQQDMLAAFQALSEYSFDYIVALKSMGDGGSGDTLAALLEKLGASPEVAQRAVGDGERPSYLHMLEVLSKTLQMSAVTHVGNMTNSTELYRRLAINEGLELMVKFEIFQSHKRATALATALHELERRELADEWEAKPIFSGRL